jgi:prepilin-type processing-associated H-X9-DG protein
MWTEAIRDTVERGRGNVIFLDGSVQGMQDSMKRLMALQRLDAEIGDSESN